MLIALFFCTCSILLDSDGHIKLTGEFLASCGCNTVEMENEQRERRGEREGEKEKEREREGGRERESEDEGKRVNVNKCEGECGRCNCYDILVHCKSSLLCIFLHTISCNS